MVATTIKKGNILKINKSLRKVQKSFDDSTFFEKLGLLINSSIQRRVQKEGLDINLREMKPYSLDYGYFKRSTGRNTSFRDLTYTGKMWQSLSVAKINSGSRMFFTGADSKNKVKTNQARTPFFGISKNEKEIISYEVKQLLRL